jgi:hypothetical protein
MRLAEAFLVSCARAVNRLENGEGDVDRFTFNSKWRDLVQHRSSCSDCHEA